MVDRDLCIGGGNCVAYAPTVFKLDEKNKAEDSSPFHFLNSINYKRRYDIMRKMK